MLQVEQGFGRKIIVHCVNECYIRAHSNCYFFFTLLSSTKPRLQLSQIISHGTIFLDVSTSFNVPERFSNADLTKCPRFK